MEHDYGRHGCLGEKYLTLDKTEPKEPLWVEDELYF